MPLGVAVENGVARFANNLHGAHFAQAVGDALSGPTWRLQAFSKMGGVKLLGQAARQQADQVGVGGEDVAGCNREKQLILDLVLLAFSTPSAAFAAAGT